jgi:hypothetical protein
MSGVSCALVAAIVPWVAVEVDLHLDLKVNDVWGVLRSDCGCCPMG